MLWLCLHFPDLPLEIFSRAQPEERPWAVSEGQGARDAVVLCNAQAQALGIRPGMSLSAAQGLAGELICSPRDAAAEERALASLAAWAGRFTSFVSLLPPQALLLEVAGSLRLFGGIHALRRDIRARLAPLGYRGEIGIAPTPLAAALLARAGVSAPVLETHELRAALRELPPALLGLEERQLHALQGMGLRRLGDLLRLPRAGLARRFGPELPDRLERLLGHRPDPRPPYRAPERFEQHLTLPAETADSEALLFPARRLLLELEGFLHRRAAGARRLAWTLSHERAPATRMDVGLTAPNRDPQHLLALLRERLAGIALTQPVIGLTLQAHEMQTLSPAAPGLDGAQGSPAEDWPLLIEKLRARLGDEAVQGLQCLADHRPERAWGPYPPGAARAPAGLRADHRKRRRTDLKGCKGHGSPGGGGGDHSRHDRADAGNRTIDRETDRIALENQADREIAREVRGIGRAPDQRIDPPLRPLWLLPQPVALDLHEPPRCLARRPALAQDASTPLVKGPLSLLQGPERIESGWWDGEDAARDYYVARDAAHARYWVFRERRGARRWFLHGYFA